ncbi:hypothetical protein Esti_006275 [Eimeria stiedai]
MAILPPPSPFIPLCTASVAKRAGGAGPAAGQKATVNMPRMLYGTAWKKERTKELCVMAMREGFRGFDTACQPKHYNQRGLGEAIAEATSQLNLKREELFIQTKYTPVDGQDPHKIPYDPRLPIREQVAASIQVCPQHFASGFPLEENGVCLNPMVSLQELGVSYIDAVLLHSPLDTLEQTIEAWRGLESAVDEGYVRTLGISNCYSLEFLQNLYAAARVKPVLIQNRFYPASGYDVALRAWCRENGITYQSFWTLTGNSHVLRDPVVTQSAERLKCTPQQLWFRYLVQRGIVPLTGTSSLQHMQEDIDWGNVRLTQTVCDQLDASLPTN